MTRPELVRVYLQTAVFVFTLFGLYLAVTAYAYGVQS